MICVIFHLSYMLLKLRGFINQKFLYYHNKSLGLPLSCFLYVMFDAKFGIIRTYGNIEYTC